MTDKIFAPDYERNESGWVMFPEGQEEQALRKTYFPDGVMKHQAKANMFMVMELIDYLTEPGYTILDPMAGTGTILMGALMGRDIVCLDVEEAYHTLQQEAVDKLSVLDSDIPGRVTLLCGDCRRILPMPVQSIIFSPPYASIMKKTRHDAVAEDLYGYTTEELTRYSASKDNVGRLSKFLYNQAMEKVYKLLYQSIPPGGTMAVIIKDYISGGQRVDLSMPLIRMCFNIGFETKDWFKREAGGSPFVKIRRAAGEPTIDWEDIILFKRPI